MEVRDLVYSKETSKFWRDDRNYNTEFVCMQLLHMSSMLKLRGYLFENEIREALGIRIISEGQTHGWLKSEGNPFMYDIVEFEYDTIGIRLLGSWEMYQKI